MKKLKFIVGIVLLIAALASLIGTQGAGGLLFVQPAIAELGCLSCMNDIGCPGCKPPNCWICSSFECRGIVVTCYQPAPVAT